MNLKFYPLFVLLLLARWAGAQTCAGLSFTCVVRESRCVATGSINVIGPDGNYNYKVIGPVTTPFTSSALITGLGAGWYTVVLKDLDNNCTATRDSVYVPGTYADPRFQLVKTDATCAGNDATISTTAQQFGRAPFTYTIVAPSPSGIGTSNSTGHFTGLIAGEYAVELRDSCGGIQVRRVTIENYVWWMDSTSVSRVGCDSADAYFLLKDNKGAASTTTGTFAGYQYGVVRAPGDTVFSTTPSFRFYLGTRRGLTLVVRDNCGNRKQVAWSLPVSIQPQVGAPVVASYTCTQFSVSLPVQQNLTNPSFCLYKGDTLVQCNTTSSFSNVPYGSYCIRVRDNCYDTTIQRCLTVDRPKPAIDALVAISQNTCSTFTATVTGQTNWINPTFCLKSGGSTLRCNSTGVFDSIPYGSYCIEATNGCADTTIVRCFTAARPVPQLTTYNIWGKSCSTFSVTVGGTHLFSTKYCLYDSTGAVVTCDSSGTFGNLPYGRYCVRAINCGDSTAPLCFTGTRPVPSVDANVAISNKGCTGFTATVTGQTNLTAPRFCLYDSRDTLLTCNNTGVFASLAYGAYCIKIKDSCSDSTLVRCFSVAQPRPSLQAPVVASNGGCIGFTATVKGNNLINPEYCLLDSAGTVLQCNTTGVFGPIGWGRYCFRVKDGCTDTTMTLCQTFVRPQGLTVSTSKACAIGKANITTSFTGGFWPFRLRYYKPTGELIADTTTNSNPFDMVLPGLPTGARYKIVGTDGCGFTDSVFVTPDASVITRSIQVAGKCPSATWQNGAGNLVVNCTSNFYPAQPVVVRKNGAVFNQSFSSVSGDQYTFADLEPATYVVEYNMQTCNSKIWDTVVVRPYTYPTQGQSAIYQCDNNTLSLGASVDGGIAPFTYQIIGSTPATPSIAGNAQSSPVFNINTGTVYSLVRMRAVDACGNASLDDVSVLPLQNFSVAASEVCFFKNVTLSVEAIPNASYTWYRKTTPSDSVLLGNGTAWNLPFFRPEEIGQYVCHIDVHGGCAQRSAAFTLDGDCGNTTLPTGIQLRGKEAGSHQLWWQVATEQGVKGYVVERKEEGGSFKVLATLAQNNAQNGRYQFETLPLKGGRYQYRIRVVGTDGRWAYSNVIGLQWRGGTRLYPNPARDKVVLLLPGMQEAVQVTLYDAAGKAIYHQTVSKVPAGGLSIPLQPSWKKGLYLVRITGLQSRESETQALMIE